MKRWILGVLLIGLPGWVLAQEPIRAGLQLDSAEGYVGQSLLLTLSVTGTDQVSLPDLPSTADWDIRYRAGGPQNSTSTVIMNGRTTVTTDKRYEAQWVVKPLRAGSLNLGPYTFTINGQKWTAPPTSFLAQAPRSQTGYKLTESLSPTSGFPGSPLTYRVKWFFSESVRAPELVLPLLDSPAFKVNEDSLKGTAGADLISVTVGNRQIAGAKSAEVLNGVQYTTLEFTAQVIPLKEGHFHFDPALVSFEGAVRYETSEDFFGRPVRSPVYGAFSIPGPGLDIDVRQLPTAGRPHPFSGLVGQVRVKTRVDGRRFRVGDPVPLTLELMGAQNLEAVDLDFLVRAAFSADLWRVGEETKLSATASSWTLRPMKPTAGGIPEIRINYFDPESASYQVAVAPAIGLDIADAPQLNLPTAGQASVTGPAGIPLWVGTETDSVFDSTGGWGALWWVGLWPGLLVFASVWGYRRYHDDRRRRLRLWGSALRAQLDRWSPTGDRSQVKTCLEELKAWPLPPTPASVDLQPLVKLIELVYFSGQAGLAEDVWATEKAKILSQLEALI